LSAIMLAAQARHVTRQSTRMAQTYPFGGRDPIAAMKGLAALLMQRPPKKKRERGKDENGLPLWWLFRQPHEEEEIENEGPALQNVKWWLLEPYCWAEPEPG